MKKATPTKYRQLHVNSKIVKGKKQFYLVCSEYFGSSSKTPKEVKYPEFKTCFDTKAQAIEHAKKSAKAIEGRTNVRFALQFLN